MSMGSNGTLLTTLTLLHAAPALLSVVPADGTPNVSPGTTVVFTFSEPMYTGASQVLFSDLNTGAMLFASPSWNGAGTILTYTPIGSFPSGTQIGWEVFAFNLSFEQVTGTTTGSFTTSGGGGGTGTGTNAITLLSVVRSLTYNQYSTGAPTLDTNYAYSFIGSATLASNRTATNITLLLPTSAVSNLTQNPVKPEMWYLMYYNTNQTTFDGLYPSGNYQFNVKAAASNQQVTVTLPVSMPQPGAPHTTSFTSAQSVDASQPFTINWDAFSGGDATDYIAASVGNWSTADPGATSVSLVFRGFLEGATTHA